MQYPLDFTNFDDSFPKSLSIDPAFASVGSKFAIVVTEYRDDLIRVLYAEEFAKATTEGMLEEIRQIRQRFMIFGDDNFRIYVDASNPAFIRSLKLDIGEYVDYEKQLHHEQEKGDINKLQYYMKVVPVSLTNTVDLC